MRQAQLPVVCATCLQVYEFYEQATDSVAVGTLYVAVPPAGLPLSALLAQVLSRALGCPFTLPLHPLLEVPDAAQLSQLQPVLHAGGLTSTSISSSSGDQIKFFLRCRHLGSWWWDMRRQCAP